MLRKLSSALRAPLVLSLAGLLGFAGCATGREMTRGPVGFTQTGEASWYGQDFHGKPTASGEPYDMWAHTAAHRELPFGSMVKVTHLDTGANTVVRINDRGPFVHGRIIDLSLAAARDLGLDRTGTGRVRIEVVGGAPAQAGTYFLQVASFENRTNADTLLDRLRAAGYRAELASGPGVTRVVIRNLNAADADRIAAELAQRGFPTPLRRLQNG
ncbi:MAG: septal ring lytic transglycosylase RlpA family protein [Spirochaetaceae bacterium]|nr:septal ring lytic transglycosylase RlpA family protein [Spirochaetaceae bacterium]